jgi:CubicO group peptidase (beta-lactamase class C family)
MKQRINLFTIALFGILLASCTRKEEIGSMSSSLDSLFKIIPDFSGVVLIAKKGKPIYHRAFGYKNFETKEPLDTTSIFELASVSKQFTAMTIMMLQEEGKLNYDDLIEKYIPGLPYQGITIRHLLNHTSGLPDYQAVMDEHWDKTKVAGNSDNIQYLIQYHPAKLFGPNEKYLYSNTGYMLLASIAEKVSGQDFITFSDERIFRPLQMKSTAIRTREQKTNLANMALGHLYVKEKQRYVRSDSFPAFNYAIWLGNRKGPGRISSTSSDLLKWDRALYTEQLVSPKTLQEAFNPARLKNDSLSYYGFGWELGVNPALGKFVSHTGDNPGYKTQIIRYIDVDNTVIILSNNAHEKINEIIKVVKEKL